MAKTVWWVYAFAEPVTQAVRYVGCAMEPYKRLQVHMSCLNVHNPELNDWLKSLRKQRTIPSIMLLEKLTFNARMRGQREKHWIEKFHAEGCKLFNKQLHPGWVSPIKGVLNPNSHAGRIRAACEKLGWDAPLQAIQQEVGPVVHYLKLCNRSWNGERWVDAKRPKKYLLPLDYICTIRCQGPRYSKTVEGT